MTSFQDSRMNIIDKVKTRGELFSLRDHIAKTLRIDLGMDIKQRKIDEITAHIIGAKNWNTAYGMVLKIDPLPEKPRLVLAKPPTEPPKTTQMWERAASELYATLINALDEHCASTGSRICRDMVIHYLGWKELKALATMSHLSATSKQQISAHLLRTDGISITTQATPSIHGYIVDEVMNNVSNYHVLNSQQVDEAMACIMDSQYVPENTDMLIYRMDQDLARHFLAYIGTQ